MKETSKASLRRYSDGDWKWNTAFEGIVLDVGSGDDPLDKSKWPNITELKPFDREQGDANLLTNYIPRESIDCLHSSQCLEHMINPYDAMQTWIEVVKPGGWLIITVPDFELYEGSIWPSRFNPDHKSSWSMTLLDSPAPIHVHVPTFLELFSQKYRLDCHAKLIDTNFDRALDKSIDQTFKFEDGVEAFIEMRLEKLK